MKKILILLILLMPVLLGAERRYPTYKQAVPDGFVINGDDPYRYIPAGAEDPALCPPENGWPCGMLLPFDGVELMGFGVRAMAVQPWDGKILLAGDFTARVGDTEWPRVEGRFDERWNLVRLNPDGTWDRSFTPVRPTDGGINTIVIQVDPVNPAQDSRIYIGGAFSTMLPGVWSWDWMDLFDWKGLARLRLDGSLDYSFNPGAALDPPWGGDTVNSLVLEPDGKGLLVGGKFSQLAGVPCSNIARISVAGATDGTVTETFGGGTDGEVNFMTFDQGRLLVSGGFTAPGNHLARYNADYTLDHSFAVTTDAPVRSVARQADGKMILGGDFTTVTAGGGPQDRQHLARLTIDETLDDTFKPHVEGGSVAAVAVQPDGRVVATGSFAGIGAGMAEPSYFARFGIDGTVEPLNLHVDGAINTLRVQQDGKYLVGGEFFNAAGQHRTGLARYYPNGVLDDDAIFDPRYPPLVWPSNYEFNAVAFQPDGSLMVGGYVKDAVTGKFGVAKLDQRWQADPSYTMNAVDGPDGMVKTLALQPDGKLLVGGFFNRMLEENKYILRVNPDGSFDNTFKSPFGYCTTLWEQEGAVIALTLLPRDSRSSKDVWTGGVLTPKGTPLEDGMVYAAGRFVPADETKPTRTLVRLKKNGDIDPTFNAPAFSEFVSPRIGGVVIQPDNKIIVTVADVAVVPLADQVPDKMYRLETNGDIDPSFISPRNTGLLRGQYLYKGAFISITTQLDRYGQLYMGGWFNELVWDDTTPPLTVTKGGVIRLNNLQYRRGDGTLTQDGSPDLDFATSLVDPLVTDTDGFVAGGEPAALALAFQADEKLLMVGNFEQATDGTGTYRRESLVRVDSSGKIDQGLERLMTWQGARVDKGIMSHRILALQSDGKVVIGGDLTLYASWPPRERINNWSNVQRFYNGEVTQELSVSQDGSTITWMRGGPAPEIWGTYFVEADSPDAPAGEWRFLGRADPIFGGWTLKRDKMLTVREKNRYVRGVGYQATSWMSLSAGIVQSTAVYYLKPILTVKATATSKTYGDPNPPLIFEVIDGLAPGDTDAVVTGSPVCDADASAGVGTYPIQKGSLYAGLKYEINFIGADLTVNTAPLTVTAKGKTKYVGDPDPAVDDYEVSGLVNGDTRTILTGSLDWARTDVPGVYPIVNHLSAGPNYHIVYHGANVVVATAAGMTPQSITFAPLPVKTLGHGSFLAGASASSGLAVSYLSSNPAVATVDAGTGEIRIVGVGTTNITASQAGNGSYDPAADVVQALVVGPPPGNALAFDGVDDVMRVGNAAQLNFGAKPGFTIESWLRLDGSQGDGAGLVSKGLAGGGAAGYQLLLHGNKIAAEITGLASSVGVAEGLIGVTSLDDGRWHHVALSVDRTLGAATLYLDGRVEKTLTHADLKGDPDNVENLMVGVDRSGGKLFKGTIDELRLWDGARSTAEIRGSVSQIIDPAANPSLVAYFHFDEGEAGLANAAVTTAPERTAHAAHGTLVGFELAGTGSNWVASGAFLPLVQTSAVTDLTATGANSGGEVFDNYYPATERGLCWATTPNPTVADSTVSSGNGVGSFAGAMAGLSTGNTYYLRAFAINAMGASYGNEVSFSLGRAGQTITIGAIPRATYGDGPITLGGTSSSGLPITYTSSNPEIAEVVGGEIRIVGAGSATITASQGGNASYDPAPDVPLTLEVAKAVLTVTADDKSRPYQAADPAFTASYSGFKNGDLERVLTGAPALSTTATVASPVGSYPIAAAVGTLGAANYTFAFAAGTLTVTAASQTISIGGIPGMTYGDPPYLPTGTSSSGLPIVYTSSDPTVAVVVGGQIQVTGAGTTVITATQPGNGNYDPATAVPLTLEVAKATLTVTADDKSRPCLAPNPAFTVTYHGFVNRETAANLTGAPALSTAATPESPAGTYPILVAGGTLQSGNYSFLFANGTLTVGLATQSITFNALKARTFGDGDFDPGATASSDLPVNYASSAPAVAAVVAGRIRILGPGSAEITASQAGNASFDAATEVVRTLTVKPPPGNAASFDGIDDLIRVGHAPQFNFGAKAGFTIETWLHLQGSQPDGTGLISKGIPAGGTGGYQLILHQDRIAGEIGDGRSSVGVSEGLLGATSLNDGRWHHVALSVDRTNATARLYLDGRLEKELTHAVLGASADNADDLLMGVDGSGARFFRGEMDELRLWDGPRTREEIRASSSQILDPSAEGHLAAYYHFDEGDAGLPNGAFTTAPERTAHGAHGSLEGFALAGSQSNWVRSGAFLPLSETAAVSAVTSSGASGGGLVYANYYPATDRGLCWATAPQPSVGGSCVHAGSGTGSFAAELSGLTPGASYYLRAFAVNGMGTTYGNEVSFGAARAGQVITVAPLAGATYGDGPIVPSGTSSSGLPVIYTSSNPAVAVIVDGEIRIVGAGTTVITVSQPGNGSYDPAPEVPMPLTVAKAVVTVTADAKSRPYLAADPPFTASYSGFVNGDNRTVLSGSPALSTTAAAASPVGSYAILAGPGSLQADNYTFAFAQGTLTITAATQSITAGPIPSLTYGDPPYTPTCTATSGLPVTYVSSNPAVAAVVNGEVRITGAGSAVIIASQPGDGNYAAAPSVAIAVVVAKAPLTVTADDKARVYQTPNPALTASYRGFVYSDTLTVISGEPALATNATQASPVGDYPIVVDLGTLAAANYRFLTVNGTFSVLKSCQQIVFPAISPVTYGDAPFTLNASACSGLDIVFTSSNPQVARVSGREVTVTGAGTAVITASQAGSHSVDTAPDVQQTLVVDKRGQSVSFPPLGQRVLGDAPFVLSATSSSGLPVSYRSSEPSVATVAGNTVTLVGAGTTVITASQEGNANYHPSLPMGQPLVVSGEAIPPALTLSTLASGAVTATPVLNVTGTASDASGIASVTVNGVELPDRAALFSSAVCLATGLNRITVAATDGAGNRSTETINVSLDATAPAIQVTAPADTSVTNVSFFTANGTVTAGSAVSMAVNGAAPQSLAVTDTTFTGTSYLSEGLNTIEWTASLQGRVSRVKRSVVYAPGKPQVALTDPVEDIHTERESLLLQGTAGSEGSGVSVVVDAGGAVFTPTVANGSFQQQIALNPNAQTRVSATVTDRDGKSSVAYRNIIHHQTIAGDVNGDGRLDIVDAVAALRISLGYEPPTAQALAHGDLAPLVNGVPQPDGKIDVGDVLIILRRVVGLVDF